MSDLSGNLESFGLRKILVLLADWDKTGELEVASDALFGRVFLQDGTVAYATTQTGDESVREVESLVDLYESDLEVDESAPEPEAEWAEPSSGLMEEALVEQITETLFRLTHADSGSFNFTAGTKEAQDADISHTLSVGDLLNRVDDRTEQWRRIEEVVPSIESPYRLATQIHTDSAEITVDARTWRLLAVIDGGSSVIEVADSLQVSRFVAAKKVADLVKQGLLEPENGDALAESQWADYERADDEPAENEENVIDAWDDDEPGNDDIADDEPRSEPTPRLQPVVESKSFSSRDLSRSEVDELVRNVGRGIYPSDS